MGSPSSIAPPDGFELDDQPNAMRQGFGRLALSPGKLKDVAGVIGNAMSDVYGRIKRWEGDPSLPSSRGDTDIGADAVALGPGMLLPGFGRAAGGVGAAGSAPKATWSPDMVRKLRQLDGEFAGKPGRDTSIIENFREVYPDYQGSDATIRTMRSRSKSWGGVNEATGAERASESGGLRDFELGVMGGKPAPPQGEFIRGAAIKLRDGTIVEGRNHTEAIMRLQNERPELDLGKELADSGGFLTSTGRYVDRVDAAQIAKGMGQVGDLKFPAAKYGKDRLSAQDQITPPGRSDPQTSAGGLPAGFVLDDKPNNAMVP